MGKYAQMIIVLSAIALVSGLALGGLNDLTYEKAQNNILKFKKVPALVEIYQGYAGALDEKGRADLEEALLAGKIPLDAGGKEPVMLFRLDRDGKPYAVAIEGAGKGYGGDVGVMTAFRLDTGDLAGIGITTLSETPGVGTRILDESFTLQFRGMPADSVFKIKKDGGRIDGISGATISSTAVAKGVELAKIFFDEHKDAILKALGD